MKKEIKNMVKVGESISSQNIVSFQEGEIGYIGYYKLLFTVTSNIFSGKKKVLFFNSIFGILVVENNNTTKEILFDYNRFGNILPKEIHNLDKKFSVYSVDNKIVIHDELSSKLHILDNEIITMDFSDLHIKLNILNNYDTLAYSDKSEIGIDINGKTTIEMYSKYSECDSNGGVVYIDKTQRLDTIRHLNVITKSPVYVETGDSVMKYNEVMIITSVAKIKIYFKDVLIKSLNRKLRDGGVLSCDEILYIEQYGHVLFHSENTNTTILINIPENKVRDITNEAFNKICNFRTLIENEITSHSPRKIKGISIFTISDNNIYTSVGVLDLNKCTINNTNRQVLEYTSNHYCELISRRNSVNIGKHIPVAIHDNIYKLYTSQESLNDNIHNGVVILDKQGVLHKYQKQCLSSAEEVILKNNEYVLLFNKRNGTYRLLNLFGLIFTKIPSIVVYKHKENIHNILPECIRYAKTLKIDI